ncbi:hypothetical protein ADL25_15275 [Streptomyces sp. NRRL F-5122]|jgi:hypothetical protein|uniref:hypothetical protein n=1 Tax=unclassified Streptomyces TaxID=2593676 RepID=UPI00074107B7|nr:hypothetical protein [Streptomyces sp. NRRL F-5122]KUJ42280.1 hypothetical protein ADL25_15275 [Streptomyces sp. NRRL F-5122]
MTGIGLVPDNRAQRLRCEQERPVIWTSTDNVAYRQPMPMNKMITVTRLNRRACCRAIPLRGRSHG